MIDIKIRKAHQKDLPQLLVFEQAIIEFERLFDETLKDTKINYYDVKGMITAKEVELLVAEYQGQLIASGYAHIMPSEPYLKHKKNAYLGFMYVVPEFRRKGINRLLVNELKTWCLSKGINEIRLDVYSDNIAAVTAYEKAGFKRNLLEMRIDLKV